MQVKGQLANKSMENQWTTTTTTTLEGNNQNYLAGIQAGVFQTQSGVTNNSSNYMNNNPISSPQSSLDSVDHHQNVTNDVGMMVMAMQDYGGVIQAKTEGIIGKKRSLDDMGELQELALRMMRN